MSNVNGGFVSVYCLVFVVALRHVSVEQKNYLLTYLLTYVQVKIMTLCTIYMYSVAIKLNQEHPKSANSAKAIALLPCCD